MSKIKKMKISELRSHPKNAEIYGENEDVSDLVEKIRRSGQVHTLVVNSKGIILAGHRRCKACIELGINEVDVEIRDFDTPEQEIEYIIDNNATREKTTEQKAREAKFLKETIAALSEKRKLSKLKQNQSSDMPKSAQRKNEYEVPKLAQREEQSGKTRDIIAPKVGLRSGQEVDRSIKVIDKIDELRNEGRIEDAKLIRDVLNNRSVSAAESLAKNIDVVEIPEEVKQDIKSGKKSPNSYIEKTKKEVIKAEIPNVAQTDVKVSDDKDSTETILTKIKKRYRDYLTVFQKDIEWLSDKEFYCNDEDVTGKSHSDLQNCLEKFKGINSLMENMHIDDLDEKSIIINR